MKPFIGNPCGFGNCLSAECEKCRYWAPCIYIYFGKNYKRIKLPKWPWLINLLYEIIGLFCRSKYGGTF